jgi:adenylate kinase family enzyme
MRPLARVHVFGAAGCGSTTLAWALARRLACQHLDVDDFYWLPTTPPFRRRRTPPERLRMLSEVAASTPRWVLSGPVAGWGDPLLPHLDLVVFLYVPTDVRLSRLQRRERARFGEAVDPGGPMHDQHQAFLRWAAGYDPGLSGGRTLLADATWLGYLPCPMMCLIGECGTMEQIGQVLTFWETQAHQSKASNPSTSEIIAGVLDSVPYPP